MAGAAGRPSAGHPGAVTRSVAGATTTFFRAIMNITGLTLLESLRSQLMSPCAHWPVRSLGLRFTPSSQSHRSPIVNSESRLSA